MKTTLLVAQIITGIILVLLVLLQAKGTGLGRSFANRSYHSRRGVEYVVFRFTILVSVLFVAAAIVGQFLA